jgi:hypothetical protein
MPKFKDLTDRRFGKLTVLLRDPHKTKYSRPQWLCRCDCGAELSVWSASLLSGNTKSCGCRRRDVGKEKINPRGGLTNLHCTYRGAAAKRGHSFSLPLFAFEAFTSSACHYCGGAPSSINRSRKAKVEYIYNGIDRIDNKCGYEIWNCLPCCNICNKAKRAMPYVDFTQWLNRVSNFYGGNEKCA